MKNSAQRKRGVRRGRTARKPAGLTAAEQAVEEVRAVRAGLVKEAGGTTKGFLRLVRDRSARRARPRRRSA